MSINHVIDFNFFVEKKHISANASKCSLNELDTKINHMKISNS
jgi:hypothetical protein